MRSSLGFLFAIIVTLVSSCGICDEANCVEDLEYGDFKLVSATTGQDLVFGPTSLYNKNKIKFYSLLATDTTFYDYQAIRTDGAGNDSVMRVLFSPLTEVAFVRLSKSDIDTLHISFRYIETLCCGTRTEIDSFRYNNSDDILAKYEDTHVLMK